MSNNDKNGLKRSGRDNNARSYTGRKCDVRLDKYEEAMLTELSENNGVTRSDVIRRALRDFYKFNSKEE